MCEVSDKIFRPCIGKILDFSSVVILVKIAYLFHVLSWYKITLTRNRTKNIRLLGLLVWNLLFNSKAFRANENVIYVPAIRLLTQICSKLITKTPELRCFYCQSWSNFGCLLVFTIRYNEHLYTYLTVRTSAFTHLISLQLTINVPLI